MTTKIFYHQVKAGVDCPDGVAAAWVAHKAMPSSEVIGCVYQEAPPVVERGDRIFILDFSFPRSVLEGWADMGAEVTVIDHHETAMNQLSGLSDRVTQRFNMNESGATLAWKFFFPSQSMPHVLRHIRDRDLWLYELDGTKEVHEAMSKIGRTFDLFDELAELTNEELRACLLPIGRALMAPKNRAIADAVQRRELLRVGEYKIPGVILSPDGTEDRLVSEICSALHQFRSADQPFTVCITSSGAYSLRSSREDNDGGFHVGEFATRFGGGGHRNAAGFTPQEAF